MLGMSDWPQRLINVVEGIIWPRADWGRVSGMSIEVEVKSRIEDIGVFERNLLKAGAKKIDDVIERDVYYSHPCRDFARTDEALRIRACGKKADLTYKGPKLDAKSKSREEIIIRLEDAGKAAAMLERLGFRHVARVRKRRRVYVLGRFEVCVDRVAGLGNYAEVEAVAPKRGYEKVRNEAIALLVRLGGNKMERRSYLELLLSRQDESGP